MLSSSAEVGSGRVSIQRVPTYFGLSLTSTVLLAVAFPEPGWGLLAHVALVPVLWLAVAAGRVWRFVWSTYLVSFAWWLYMLRWMTPVTGGGYAALAAYLAVYLVTAMLFSRWLHRRYGWPLVLALPLSWVPAELVRGYILAGGFGWYALAHSQAPWRGNEGAGVLVQCADLFGEQGVSFLVAMTNGLIVDLLVLRFRPSRSQMEGSDGSPSGGLGTSRRLVTVCVIWGTVYATAFTYGRVRIAQVSGDAESVRIAVVQTNVPQDNKERPTRQTEEAAWRQIERLTREAAANPSLDLIVWPESSTPAHINADAVRANERWAHYWDQVTPERLLASSDLAPYQAMAAEAGVALEELPGEWATRYRQWAGYARNVADLARETGTALVVGSLTRLTTDPPRRYNSVFLFDGLGVQTPSRYDKVHLVPFGEFIPWVDGWPWLKEMFLEYLTPYDYDYTVNRGTDLTVFAVARLAPNGHVPGENPGTATDIRFATPICFEDTVPRLIRRMVYRSGEKRVDLLVNVSNDGWFAGTIQGYQHMQVASLRCIENRVPMVRSVNTGPSGFIDSVGRVGPLATVAGRTCEVEAVLVHGVRFDVRKSLFGRWGEGPVFAVAALMGALTLFGAIIRSNNQHL